MAPSVFIGSLTAISAFCGGYFSDYLPERALKIIFAVLLAGAAAAMLRPVTEKGEGTRRNAATWYIESHGRCYSIDLIMVIPVVIITGFCAGMVGVSGGSFLVPLMVLACDVPMKTAVGTSMILVSITALTGFLGHSISGHFDVSFAIPLALAGTAGGIVGSSMAMKARSSVLKILFVMTSFVASGLMAVNAFLSG